MTITHATRVVTCALAIVAIAFSAQAQVFQQQEEAQPQQQPQPQPQQPAQPQQPNQFHQLHQPEPRPVATVNGDAITEPELDSAYTRTLAAIQQRMPQGQQIDPAAMQGLRNQVLDDLIDRRLVEQYVIEEGPDVEQTEIQATVAEVKEQVQTQGANFDDFLTSQGLTENSFQKRIEGSLAWQKYQQQVVTEPKLQEFFEQNKEHFPADDFQQARPEVTQAYTASVWEEIVQQMRPGAEIELVEDPAGQQPPAGQPLPGGFPPQQR